MKHKLLISIACGTSAMILSERAKAASVSLVSVLEVPSQMTAAGLRDIYRVYAQFDDPGDRVNAWYGNAASAMFIQNVLADGESPGSGFTQFGGAGGQTAPYSFMGVREWDTYATLGIRQGSEAPGGSDATTLSPGFPVFIAGHTLVADNAAVSITSVDIQGRADYRVVGNDTNLRVMLMQLTVMPGQHVRGTINVDGEFWNGSAYEDFSATGLTFASIPAPGALGMLGIAVCGCRRRRRSAGA